MTYYTTSNAGDKENGSSNNGKINYITDVSITPGRIPTGGSSKNITVKGSTEVNFSMEITRSSDGAYYNFETNLFSTPAIGANISRTSVSRLKNASIGSYTIVFPSNASGDVYTILIWPETHFNTELSFGPNKRRHAIKVTQLPSNVTVTIATEARIGKTAVTTLGTSVGISGASYSTPQSIRVDKKQVDFTSHADDHGVIITKPLKEGEKYRHIGGWDSSYLYWQTGNYVANGAGTDSTALILDSVDGLYVGMQVSHVDGTFHTALRTITAIDTDTKTLTLSGNETWSDEDVILFRAYGHNLIRSAIGIGLSPFWDGILELGEISTTLRTAITSGGQTTANIVSSLGFGVGVDVRGLKTALRSTIISNDTGVDAETTSTSISDVHGSTTVGILTVANAQFVNGDVGTVIYADGCSNILYLWGEILIDKYPDANQTISLDLNKFLTAGTNE